MSRLEKEHAVARPWLVQAGKERADDGVTAAAPDGRRDGRTDTCANGGGATADDGGEWDFGKKFSKSDAERRPQSGEGAVNACSVCSGEEVELRCP